MQLSIQIFVSIFDINAFGGRFFHLNTIDIIDDGFLTLSYRDGMDRSEIYCYFSKQFSAFSIEISQGKVLLYLLEKRLDLPTTSVYRHYRLQRHVEIVGKQRDEFRLLAFLDIDVCD